MNRRKFITALLTAVAGVRFLGASASIGSIRHAPSKILVITPEFPSPLTTAFREYAGNSEVVPMDWLYDELVPWTEADTER